MRSTASNRYTIRLVDNTSGTRYELIDTRTSCSVKRYQSSLIPAKAN